ncbi:uncharacterized protein [Dermacentor andersoni]|uniref:uncharacterized protein n=1 Tax=Dermacentor andersoni TaxID=34620 RepID=UPI0024167300|nr:uncharacterized protein LOC126537728 [Dermacentor andersoni]
MDGGGASERGGHHRRSGSKHKRPKHNKAQASGLEGKVVSRQSRTISACREPGDGGMSLGSQSMGSPIPRATPDGASSRHFDRSKSQPGAHSKLRSKGSRQHLASVDAGAPRSALSPSKRSIDASRSKPCDERVVKGETRQTTATHTAAGTEIAKELQDAAEPAVPPASETVAKAHKDGAAAAKAPAVIEPRTPSLALTPLSVAAAPPKQQADHGRKSKAAKDRDQDADNRPSMESFTPLDVMKKSNLATTTAQWSFYPMNVTFVTEADSKEERYLYATVVVVVGVIFTLALVTLALLLSSKRHETYVTCDTPECREAQDSLTRLLNTSKDACNDFYGYVCDSWLARSSGSFLGDSAAASIAKMSERLLVQNVERAGEWAKTLSEGTGIGSRIAEGTHVMRGLYQKCHRYVSEKSTTSTDFNETLEAARRDLNWTLIRGASSFHDLVALVTRTSLLAGFHTVFALNVLNENGKLLLRLSAGKSLLCKLTLSWSRKELEGHLRRVIDDVQELTHVLRLDDVVADDLGCEDDGGAAMDDESVPLSTLFADLAPGVNASDWVDILHALVLPSAKADADFSDVALMSRADSVRTAFGKIYDPDDVSAAAKYLASHLDADLLFLELSKERVAADAAATASFCLALARRCLSYAWPQLVARLLDLGHSTQVLHTMYRELKKSRRASLFKWLMDASRYAVKEKIARAGLLIVSKNFNARDGAKADYAWLASHLEESGGTDFVRFFVRALEHEHTLQLRSPPTRLQMLMLRLEQRSELAHAASLDAVLVPTLYQRPPLLYSAGVPAYFNYGTVGALLAARIVDVITPAATASGTLPGKLVRCLFHCCYISDAM